jgi:hypothetical protein
MMFLRQINYSLFLPQLGERNGEGSIAIQTSFNHAQVRCIKEFKVMRVLFLYNQLLWWQLRPMGTSLMLKKRCCIEAEGPQ